MKFKKYLNESMQRHCAIYKAKNKKWYMELADDEYGEQYDATTYGPFNTFKAVEDYLDQFSNPGGMNIDKSGKKMVPKRSPNGMPVEKPRR
jgi:hypothetical protein